MQLPGLCWDSRLLPKIPERKGHFEAGSVLALQPEIEGRLPLAWMLCACSPRWIGEQM